MRLWTVDEDLTERDSAEMAEGLSEAKGGVRVPTCGRRDEQIRSELVLRSDRSSGRA